MIRIASMVGGPDLETPTLAPYSGDLEQACLKLAALGYDGIELMTKQPSALNAASLKAVLTAKQLKLVGLCTGHVFGEDRLGLVTPELQIDPRAIVRLKEFIDFAVLFGNGTMVNIGRSRGLGDPKQIQRTLSLARDAIQELADYARPKKVRLILEPINKAEASFIHSTQEGSALVRLVNRPNFGLMLDTYHMFLEDVDLIRSLYEAAPYCWYLHFSDSNRRWPGSASIHFDQIIETLNSIGYDGFIGTEIQAWPDPDTAARCSIEYLRKFIPLGKDPRL
jgi:sugar phosphate isomerase/epimerase